MAKVLYVLAAIVVCLTATPGPTSAEKEPHTTKKGSTTTYTNYTGGEIRSPGYPNDRDYDNNLNVSWVIKVDPTMTVVLKIKDFDTRSEDTLKVYDRNYTMRRLLKTYSGYQSESVYSTSYNHVELHFESNAGTRSKGFLLEWYLLDSQGNEVAQTNNVPTERGSTFSMGGIIGAAVGISVGLGWSVVGIRRHYLRKKNANRSCNTTIQNGANNQRTGYLNQSYGPATPMQSFPTQTAPMSSGYGYESKLPPLPQGYHNPVSPQQGYEQNPPPQRHVDTTPAPLDDKMIPTGQPPNNVPQSANTYGSQQFHAAQPMSQSSPQGLPAVDLPPPPSYDAIDMYSVGPTPNAAMYKPPGANE